MRKIPKVISLTTLVALCGTFAPFLAGDSSATDTSATSTQSLKAQAAQIASQITLDNQQLQITGEQFGQASAQYAADQAKLASIRHQVRRETLELRSSRLKMRDASVTAYVYGVGAQAEAVSVLSSKNLSDANTLSTYASVATTQLHNAVIAVKKAQTTIIVSEHHQASITASAANASSAAQTARADAESAQQNAKSELSKVRGQLAQIIVEQEAAAATAAAAAAAAAATAAARSQAQIQAQNASLLAQTVAAADPTGASNAAAALAVAASATANNIGAPTVILGPASNAGNAAVAAAESVAGVPYVWGGASTATGFDCSGLTMFAWQTAGVSLPHNAYFQYLLTQQSGPISIASSSITLEPGDILYYFFPDDGGQPVTHDVMYVGSGPYGASTVIAAPQTGENVMYQPLYWGGYVGAGRP